jgi:hypothetical protein
VAVVHIGEPAGEVAKARRVVHAPDSVAPE